MKCPRCNFDGQIIKNTLVLKEDGKLVRVLTFACRNKNCSMNGKEIGKEEVIVPYKKEGEDNESGSES